MDQEATISMDVRRQQILLSRRIALFAGVAAPMVYVATVAFGAAQRPGYSHVSNAISELVEAGQGAGLQPFFLTYNVLVIIFAFALCADPGCPNRRLDIGAFMLGFGGALGLLMAFFPMDPRGSPATFPGLVHLVIAGAMSISSMACLLCFALGWRTQADSKARLIGTLASLAVVFVSGALAAFLAANGSPLMGLFERVTIGAYLIWMLAVAVDTLRRPGSTQHLN